MTDSDRRHPRCKRGALPAELIPHNRMGIPITTASMSTLDSHVVLVYDKLAKFTGRADRSWTYDLHDVNVAL